MLYKGTYRVIRKAVEIKLPQETVKKIVEELNNALNLNLSLECEKIIIFIERKKSRIICIKPI